MEVGPYGKTRRCPYWTIDKRYSDEKEIVGYCKYLKIGDKDHNGVGLLFDKVKECGVKDYE